MHTRAVILLSVVLLMMVGGCASMAPPSVTPSIEAEPVDLGTQLAQYVEVQEALAADNFEEARTQLEAFAQLADGPTTELAAAALQSDDIEALRAKFKPLSESLTAMDLPQGFAHAFCPMYDAGTGAPWVQRDGPVRNPYYGTVMLTCGDIGGDTTAHMDHVPRHGGTVFMGADSYSFLHVEGTYPEAGLFRLYATNGDREPVDIGTWAGRAVTEERYDEATDEFVEVAAFDLVPSPDGAYLEALIPNGGLAADVTAKVTFQENLPAQRFDFIFAELTVKDSASAVAGTIATDGPESVPLAQRIMPDIPTGAGQIVDELTSRDQQIVEMIERGAFTEIFIPALQAKELALALEEHGGELPERSRNQMRIAVRHLVRAAYMLDWYGDLGDKIDVDSAYRVFGSAIGEISAVYEQAAP
jgi:hypothetical protein